MPRPTIRAHEASSGLGHRSPGHLSNWIRCRTSKACAEWYGSVQLGSFCFLGK